MRCPDCGTTREDEDQPCEPCSVPGARGILGDLDIATTMDAGQWFVWKAEPGRVEVRLSAEAEAEVVAEGAVATIDAALHRLTKGWKYVVERPRYETRSDGWIVVCKMMRGNHGPVTGMAIRRRVGSVDVDVFAEDNDGKLNVDAVEAFAASLITAPPGTPSPPRWYPAAPPPALPPDAPVFEPWVPAIRYAQPHAGLGTESALPAEAPILRAAYGMGCFNTGGGVVLLWRDGTAQYTGPRYGTGRSGIAKLDPGLVAELYARICAAPCCTHPHWAHGRPLELHVWVDHQWRPCAGRDLEGRFADVVALTGLTYD